MAKNSVKPDAAKLKAARLARGWRIEDLAAKARCSPKSIQNAEGGKNLHVQTLKLLAGALSMEPVDLMDEEIRKASATPAGVEVIIETDLSRLNYSGLDAFVELLSKMMPESGRIVIKDVRQGSMKLILGMNALDAAELMANAEDFQELAREVIRSKAVRTTEMPGVMDELRRDIYRKEDGKYYAHWDSMESGTWYLSYLTDMLTLAENVTGIILLSEMLATPGEWKPSIDLPFKHEVEISEDILLMVGFPLDAS